MTRILVFGTSVDHGFYDTEGGWVQRLREKLDKYTINNQDDYSIYNLSISGDTTERILNRMENEIKARNNDEALQIWLEVGGGNDSQVELETGENWISREAFKENVEACIDIAEDYADEVVLFTTTPVDESLVYPMPWKKSHGYKNSEKEDYTKILREIVENRELTLVDFFREIDKEAWKDRLEDGVHPNAEGHEQLYRIAKSELKKRELIPEDLDSRP